MRVLLLEDNRGDVCLISMELNELDPNLELMIIKNGQNALNYIQNIEENPELDVPELIILGSTRPVVRGIEILTKMQKYQRVLPESVVIYTDGLDYEFNEQALDLGVSGFFTKSADLSVVKDRIRTIYEIAQLRMKKTEM